MPVLFVENQFPSKNLYKIQFPADMDLDSQKYRLKQFLLSVCLIKLVDLQSIQKIQHISQSFLMSYFIQHERQFQPNAIARTRLSSFVLM